MKIEGIIFDLDGVLNHTDELHYRAWKQIADKIGVPFDRKINDGLRGVSRMESLEIILNGGGEKFSETEKQILAEEKNTIYRNYLSRLTEKDVSAETFALLEGLRKMNLKLAVGSSSKNAGFILGQLGLGEYFDAVSDGNNITKSKPDPEVFVKAAQFIGKEPEVCLVVEDAKAGVEAAKAGGMDCAAIGDAVKCGMAEHNLSTFADLLQVVQES